MQTDSQATGRRQHFTVTKFQLPWRGNSEVTAVFFGDAGAICRASSRDGTEFFVHRCVSS